MPKPVAALFAVLALVLACGEALPPTKGLGPADAGTPQLDNRDADYDNRDPNMTARDGAIVGPIRTSESSTPVEGNACAQGSVRGRGVMSGLLEADALALEPTATLTRVSGPIPDIFIGVEMPTPVALQRHAQGLLVPTGDGFYDVSASGLARFHIVVSEDTRPQVISGDLDGDGDEDAVSVGRDQLTFDQVANEEFRGMLFFVFWERVDNGALVQRGMLRTERSIPLPAFALADYDRDGDLDLLGYADAAPLAFRNEGAFAFADAELDGERPIGTIEQARAFAEDRNDDGAVDLIAIGRPAPGEEAEAWVFLNDGAGGFDSAITSTLGAHSPHWMQMGDLTGDGLADLVVLDTQHTYPRLLVARSAAATRFDSTIATDVQGASFTLADIDGDGTLDIAAALGDSLTIALTRGDLEFESRELPFADDALVDLAIEPPSGERPARLHALFNAACRAACDAECTAQCIFNACVGCIVDDDCEDGQVCRGLACELR